eukprot:15443979-Alexandrium_andersonii.AAC.1
MGCNEWAPVLHAVSRTCPGGLPPVGAHPPDPASNEQQVRNAIPLRLAETVRAKCLCWGSAEWEEGTGVGAH